MEIVDTAPGPRIGAEAFAQIDPEEYLNRAVNMFHGVEETVTLVCDNEISNVVFDLWPEAKQKTRRVDEDHFRVKFNIYVSNQFFAQLCGLGGHVRIKSPNDIRKQYIAFLKENIYILDALRANNFKTEVGPGVYDIHSPRVPSEEEIVNALSRMLARINPEKLWVNPDCGLKTRGTTETVASLKNMVAAAKRLRANNE